MNIPTLILAATLLKSHKKTAAAITAVGILTGGVLGNSYVEAAIPVIDTANIAKQAETLAETIKVVTNTAEQVSLMLKDMKVLPESVYKKYTDSFNKGQEKIADVLNNNGAMLAGTTGIAGDTNVNKVDVSKFLSQNFPGLSNSNYSMDGRTTALLTATGALLRNNENTVAAYQEIMKALDDTNTELGKLLEQSANVEGSVQAQQISNQIQAKQAQIESLRTALSALDAQQKVMTSQAEAQEKKNQIDLATNQGEAEKKAAQQIAKDYEDIPASYAFGDGFRDLQ